MTYSFRTSNVIITGILALVMSASCILFVAAPAYASSPAPHAPTAIMLPLA